MKISKQERIIIICLIVAVILGVGIFMFVLPNFNQIDKNNKQLDSVKLEYANLQTELEREATIDNEIETAYEEGKNLADGFYDDLTSYEADEIMRQFIARFNGDEEKITINGLDISAFTTQSLSVSVFTETEVTYPLKDFADTQLSQAQQPIDFNAMNAREKVMYAKSIKAAQLAASEPVTVGSITVALTVNSDELQNLHDFVDMLYSGIYDEDLKDEDGNPRSKATYLHSVVYQMTDTSDSENTTNNNNNSNTPAEGEDAPAGNNNNNNNENEGYSMELSVDFLCIKPVENPTATE